MHASQVHRLYSSKMTGLQPGEKNPKESNLIQEVGECAFCVPRNSSGSLAMLAAMRRQSRWLGVSLGRESQIYLPELGEGVRKLPHGSTFLLAFGVCFVTAL
jgi:hypothetical protein